MTPFYFGTSRSPLFGLYQPPESESDRRHGVVLCQSLGREQILAHRSFRQVATQLARAGFHVLRFDYHGCGDSSGHDEDWSLERWSDDVATALDELKDYGDLTGVSLLGLRLGASLVAAAQPSGDVERAVLWQPVYRGHDYVQELIAQQAAWRRDEGRPPTPVGPGDGFEVLGFRVTPTMRNELEAVDLMTQARSPARRTLVIEQEPTPDGPRLAELIRSPDRESEYRSVEAPRFWVKGELDKAQVPMPVVQAVVSWMSEETP